MGFILKMAWRDTRASRRRLLLFSLSIVLGVAALVAIGSLRDNLSRAIDDQTKALLGADLVVNSRAALTPEAEQFMASLGGDQSREIAFNSMLSVPGGASRIVQVRALAGGFPYYGEFETKPAGVRASLAGDEPVAILEESMMVQFGLKPGDKVRLGRAEYAVVGGLLTVPGENAAFATLAPRVFIPLATVTQTGLLQPGSLARHRSYLRFADGTNVEKLVAGLRDRFRELRLGFDTVEERKRELGNSIRNVNAFLMLVGFASLFLGAIGVASAIHAHVRQKIPTVAVLRCLGARARTGLAIYVVQGLGLGVLGAGLGAVLGLAVQVALPSMLQGVLPFSFDFHISWPAVLRGVGAGLAVCLLFSLLPLLEVRRVSPLLAIRSAFATAENCGTDWLRWAVIGLLLVLVYGFAILQAGRPLWGVGFATGLLAGFGILAGLAKVVAMVARRLNLRRLPFAWRQGLANLYRPNNRTVLLLVSLGLGTFLLMTLYLSRGTLLGQLERISAGERPNLMLFDIQDDQVDGLKAALVAAGAPARDSAAIVTMRVAALKGRPVADLLKDDQVRIPAWTLRREYRSTYRSALSDTEKVVAGAFTGEVDPARSGPVPVSLEEALARDMQLKVGDTIDFDVQGVPVQAVVGSIRQVDWQRMSPNFFVVFPAGVLEAAPKFHVMAVRVADAAQSARVQQAVVKGFPNVSVIDLAVILQAIDTVYSKATFVVQFLALFTVVTGIIVLAGAVLIGRHQRVRESVLLRTLGATKAQVNRIMLAEYLALGTLGAAVGAVLAVGANWALARFVFQLKWVTPEPTVLLLGWAGVTAVTVITGLLASRGIGDHPPLAILRQET